MRVLTPGWNNWPQPMELKPFEGQRISLVIRHRLNPAWTDNGKWEGTLLKAHADWWTSLLLLDDGSRKFLDIRHVVEWEVAA